jgi:predicted nucleotidyltransferase/DNA-binding XRE family transcriptional regulator
MDARSLLRQARTEARLSQSELARRAGTSQAAISRYEQGVESPTVTTLERVLAAAGARLEAHVVPMDVSYDVRSGRLAKIHRHRAEIRAAARRAGATRIEVFGSVARGQDGPDSDVDFLVDLDVREVGLFPLMDLTHDLEEILGERVDVVSRHVLAEHVAPSALDDAVVV